MKYCHNNDMYLTTAGQLEVSSKKSVSSICSRFFHMFSSILWGGSRSASCTNKLSSKITMTNHVKWPKIIIQQTKKKKKLQIRNGFISSLKDRNAVTKKTCYCYCKKKKEKQQLKAQFCYSFLALKFMSDRHKTMLQVF